MTTCTHLRGNHSKTASDSRAGNLTIDSQFHDWLFAQSAAIPAEDHYSNHYEYQHSKDQPEISTACMVEHLERAVKTLRGHIAAPEILSVVLPVFAFNRILLITQRHYSAWLFSVPFSFQYEPTESDGLCRNTLLTKDPDQPIWRSGGKRVRQTSHLARLMRALEAANPGLLTGVFLYAELEQLQVPKRTLAKLISDTSTGLFRFPGTPYNELETESSIRVQVEAAIDDLLQDQPDLNPGPAQLVELKARMSLVFDHTDSFSRLPPSVEMANSYTDFYAAYGTLLNEATKVLLPEISAHKILPLVLNWLLLERLLARANAFAYEYRLSPVDGYSRTCLFRLPSSRVGKAVLRQMQAFDRVAGTAIADQWEAHLVGDGALSGIAIRKLLRVFDWEGNRSGHDMVRALAQGIDVALAAYPQLYSNSEQIRQIKSEILPLFGSSIAPAMVSLPF